jgi:hypothetical protein
MYKPYALAAIAAALAAVAQPAAADAAAVALDRGCYSEEELITQTGTGFRPHAPIRESVRMLDPATSQEVDGFAAPIVATDASGAFTRRIFAPDLASPRLRRENATSTFTDEAAPDSPVVVDWILSGWDIEIARWENGKARPRKRMRIETWGWTTAGDTLFAHYFRAGKRVKTVQIAELDAPCGDLTTRVRQFPFSPVKSGRWKVYFSATETLDKADDPWFRYTVRVRPGAGTASASSSVLTRHPGSRGR